MRKRGRKSAAEMEIRHLIGGDCVDRTDRTKVGQPQAPKHLRQAGAAFFNSMLSGYELNGAAAVAVLVRAAEAVDRIAAAQASIAKDGEIITNQYGVPKLNPACVLEKEARNGFLSAMRMLNVEFADKNPLPSWVPRKSLRKPWETADA
jgi:hypothetical protein